MIIIVMKNLYNILEIEKTDDIETIKKSYKRLVKKYHPDKNIDKSGEKFKELTGAYQILSDPNRKKQYDDMTGNDKILFNDMFIRFVNGAKNVLWEYLKVSMNMEKMSEEEEYVDSCMSVDETNELNIICDLRVELIEKYLGRRKKIKFERKVYQDGIYKNVVCEQVIKLEDNQIIIEDLGDEKYVEGRMEKGNLIVNVLAKNKKGYKVDGFNLIRKVKISLYEYVCGIKFEMDHMGEKMMIDIKEPIYELGRKDRVLYWLVSGKGLLNGLERGDLYIIFNLEMDKVNEEVLKYYYPVINKII
jgi:DnaJ-class molecular chaperone